MSSSVYDRRLVDHNRILSVIIMILLDDLQYYHASIIRYYLGNNLILTGKTTQEYKYKYQRIIQHSKRSKRVNYILNGTEGINSGQLIDLPRTGET